MKHLWEISDWIYPEVTMNHGEKGYFDSWENTSSLGQTDAIVFLESRLCIGGGDVGA